MANDKLIKQANALTTSKFSSEKHDLNIIYAIMGQIKEDDTPLTLYTIKPANISEHTGRRVRNDDFEKAVNRLLSTIFAITDEKGTLKTTFISSALFLDDGSVTVAIDVRLRPYLFELKKNFTIFGLHAAISLNSVYASRLYLMLCQFRSTGKMWLKVDELKERLGLIAHDGTHKYPLWSMFEKKVLVTAKNEINEKVDFQIDYELKKKGKKIDEIVFSIKKTSLEQEITVLQPQTKALKLSPEEQDKYNRLIERISQPPFSLSKVLIDKVLKWEYSEPRPNPSVWKHIATARDTAGIDNRGAYLVKLLGL